MVPYVFYYITLLFNLTIFVTIFESSLDSPLSYSCPHLVLYCLLLGGPCPPTFVICRLSHPNGCFGSTFVHMWLTPFRLPPPLRSPQSLLLPGSLGSTFVRLTCMSVCLFSTSPPPLPYRVGGCVTDCYCPHPAFTTAFTIVVPPQSCPQPHVLRLAFNILVLSSGAFFAFLTFCYPHEFYPLTRV